MTVVGRVAIGCLLQVFAVTMASACAIAPDRVRVERYYAEARARATVVVIGTLKAHRKGGRQFGLLTTERVLKGPRKRTYLVTSQALMCTYSIPSMGRAVFYLEPAPGGFQLAATSAAG